MGDIEDRRYLAVIDSMQQELQTAIIEFNRQANGLIDKEPLIALRLEQIDALRGILDKHHRILRFQRGEKVEPVAHSAEVVLQGVGTQF